MTRGKYAERATGRREAAEVEASEAAYQRQIVRLTQERDKARAELAKIKTDSAAEARKLRAQISEGTSSLVAALRIELNKNREARDASERELKRCREISERSSLLIQNHMIAEHGAKPGIDSFEKAAAVMVPELMDAGPAAPDGRLITVGVEHEFAKKHGNEAARALRKARGQA